MLTKKFLNQLLENHIKSYAVVLFIVFREPKHYALNAIFRVFRLETSLGVFQNGQK